MAKPKTLRVTALSNLMVSSGAIVPGGTSVELPTDEAEHLIEIGNARLGDPGDEPPAEPAEPASASVGRASVPRDGKPAEG